MRSLLSFYCAHRFSFPDMKLCVSACRAAARQFHSSPGCGRAVLPVQATDSIDSIQVADDNSVESFRQKAFTQKIPLLFRRHRASPTVSIPAFKKWFSPLPHVAAVKSGFSQRLDKFQHVFFLYEIVTVSEEKLDALNAFNASLAASQDMDDQVMAGVLRSTIAGSPDTRFYQLYAPLKLLYRALEFNQLNKARAQQRILDIYIAQSLLADLPAQLQQDLPSPRLVLEAGKGDVYSSSIWLGTEPTYTPLHRDPNPNLFCQLYNHKVVRLLPPQAGEQLFLKVQAKLQQQGSSRIRGTDMMEGQERGLLHEAVWQTERPVQDMCEAELQAGDALFIPQGWWHSVKSKESSGGLNASVNWWFR